ncbi:MAG: hypothetical protein ABIQ95_10955 [Bdellovibrionia bacterium]
MKKGTRAVLVIGSLAMILGAQNAMAGMSVELLGNGTYSMATGTPTSTPAFGYPGGGLNLNINFGSKTAFQLGGHYVTRVLTTDANSTSNFVSLNAGLKFFLSRVFSLTVGGYYNYYLTNPLGLSTSDQGLAAGIGWALPLSSSIDFLFSPTYHYALVSQTYGAANSVTSSEIVGFVGFVIGGRSK